MSELPHSRLPLRCWAEIDLAALERNLRLIRASLPAHMRYVAVVKADAYGHGLPQTAARLMHAGADLFAVATLSEAAAVRELGPGWPILLLSPLLPEEDRYLADYDLAATVSGEDEVARQFATNPAVGVRSGIRQNFERERVKRIPCENRSGLVERLVHRWLAAPKIVIVHAGQIVMDQRMDMDTFDCEPGAQCLRSGNSEQIGGGGDQYRP